MARGSPSTWKGRARRGACLASITRTVVILVGPPFGSHGRSGCVVATGDRGGRHGTVTPGRPAHRWRRAASARPVIRVGPGPPPRLADDDPAAHPIAGLRGQHHDLLIDPTRAPATAIRPCRSQPNRSDTALCVLHPVGEGQQGRIGLRGVGQLLAVDTNRIVAGDSPSTCVGQGTRIGPNRPPPPGIIPALAEQCTGRSAATSGCAARGPAPRWRAARSGGRRGRPRR